MDLSKISLSTPIMPYIEIDGGYAQCHRCWTEIYPENDICPNCKQIQDWSWFWKGEKPNEKD